jgi:hypothetical protein
MLRHILGKSLDVRLKVKLLSFFHCGISNSIFAYKMELATPLLDTMFVFSKKYA